jgi:hypothetical protein
VKTVVELLAGDDDEFGTLDPSRITEIDHGDYQGTLLFVIASNNYQPDTFWYVKVSYGSCSACDTLQAILGYGDPVTEQQAADYYVLATHIVQGLKEMP